MKVLILLLIAAFSVAYAEYRFTWFRARKFRQFEFRTFDKIYFLIFPGESRAEEFCDIFKKHGYYPDYDDASCKSYFYCGDGIATEHVCEKGKLFSDDTNECRSDFKCDSGFMFL